MAERLSYWRMDLASVYNLILQNRAHHIRV
jgi:hypothetical protein